MRSAEELADQQIADTVPTAVLGEHHGGHVLQFIGELRVRPTNGELGGLEKVELSVFNNATIEAVLTQEPDEVRLDFHLGRPPV